MPQTTGKHTIVGTYELGGTTPTIAYDTLPVGTPTTWSIVAVNASLEATGDPEPQRDGNGKVNGFIHPESVQMLEMTAKIQAAASGGIAAAQAAAVCPAPGSKITLANFIKSTHTLFNGDYILDKCKLEISDSETEPAKITISARKYETATDTLLATVS